VEVDGVLFKEEGSGLDFPKMEHIILDFWKRTSAFQKRRSMNQDKKRWSFMDGPITANNPMAVHHAWGRTYKDVFHRYKAMRGFEIRYQNGFDCQGLWIEVEIEKELGFKSKKEVEAYGIDEFVKRCKQRVLRFAAIQVEQSIRLGYWMDWDDPNLLRNLAERLERPNEIISIKTPSGKEITGSVESIVGTLGRPDLGGSYFTFSDENNYSIWAALKRCYENGWIRKGTDVMPWCPRCSTALSEHEIVTEGYRELKHIALTVKFPLRGRPKEALLVWTTTPWTLSSNVAAAVNPDIVYVKVRLGEETFYLAKAKLNDVLPSNHEVVAELKGSELEGWLYDGPFDELPAIKNNRIPEAHRVILWKDVSETEGTGIVHIAPGCGKEDFELGKMYGLPTVAPLNEFGRFIDGFDWLTGMHAYDTPKPVIDNLRSKGLLFGVEEYIHRYPVCWRCESELVFRLVDEWFISMGAKYDKPLEEITEEERSRNLRYQIIESAKQVRWIPEFGLQQELDWLMNMSDWMISKKRYWGLALPIWECHNCGSFEVIGGKEELKDRAVSGWEEFEGHSPHKPWIDKVKIKCKNCGAIISRIPDVGNPWLDAGIVSFSTLNYRHDREYWSKWFPADLICESLPGQFRNWFYSMLAMSTIMVKRAPFLTCLGHGTVLGEDGREMHKSWGNAIEFDDAVETIGADVMRWMYCTTKPENDMLFKFKRADEVKRDFFLLLWNVYSFFVTYANLDGWTPRKEEIKPSPLDLWILSRLQVLVEETTACMEKYDIYGATKQIEEFVNDLSTWYLRRSRRRFWKSEADADKEAGYATLYNCLVTLIKLLAPFAPFISEHIYQNLVRSVDQEAPESVHHNEWPEPDKSLVNKALISQMELAIRVCSLGRSARSAFGIKLRQPLSKATIVADKETLEQLQEIKDLIADELNVKELTFTTDRKEVLDFEIKVVPKEVGAKYGPLLQKIFHAMEVLDSASVAAKLMEKQPIEIEVENQRVMLLPEELQVLTKPKKGKSIAEEKNILVAVDISITDDLKSEGIARDIVRRIQNERKAAGLKISDKIDVYYRAGPKLARVLQTHREYIASETLSETIEVGDPPKGSHRADFKLEGEHLSIGIVLHEKG
jgi:isoleucyl-tRNA synthetase